MLTLSEIAMQRLKAFAKEATETIKANLLSNKAQMYKPKAERQKMADSVGYEVNGDTLLIYGGKWVFTYEYGRGPTVNDGDGAVRRQTLAYIKEEGIQAKGTLKDGSAISQETLAYFISKGIHEKGSLHYRMKTQSGTLSEAVNEEKIVNLGKELLDIFSLQATSLLLNVK